MSRSSNNDSWLFLILLSAIVCFCSKFTVVCGFQQQIQRLQKPYQLTESATSLMMARRAWTPPQKESRPKMNEQINFPTLRVVTPNPKGKDDPLGVMSLTEAFALAKEMGSLDLVLVNGKSDPPVCKIVDYSKYRYMQEKKAKETKKKSKATEVKEVKMSYKIDVHDYEVRKKNALKFLNQGNRVKCTVVFKGREIQHDKLGFELLEKLSIELEDTCVRESKPRRDGRFLSYILSPRPDVMKKINERRRAAEKTKKKNRKEAYTQKLEEKEAEKVTATESDVKSVVDGDDDTFLDDVESSLDDLLGDDYVDDLFD